MRRFIAYFDFLGYKHFILNNPSDYLRTRASHILRDIELSLAGDNDLLVRDGVYIPDIGQTTLNCLNISDTVIFWTRDNSLGSLKELLAVSRQFNWRQNLQNMPARGVIVCEEMEMLRNNEMNTGGAIYSTSLIYGRGLYNAHAKSESLNFAGCVVDNSVFNDIPEEVNIAELMLPYGKLYSVPYKQQIEQEVDEYVLNIINGRLNEQAFQNYSESIRTRFSCDNKPVSSERVQELIRNSITFLTTFCE